MQARTATIRIEEPFRKTWREPVTIISAEELKRAESGDSIDGAEIDSINSKSRQEQKGVSEIVKRITPSMPDIRIISDEKNSEQNNNNENLTPSCVIFRTPQKRSCEMMNASHCLSSNFHKACSDSYLCEKSDWMLGERSSSRSPPSPSMGSRSPQLRSRSPIVNMSPSVRHASNEFNFSPESTEHYRCEVEAESQRVKKRLFEEVTNGSYLTSITPASYHQQRDAYMSPRHHRSSRDHATYEHVTGSHDLGAMFSRDHQEPESSYYLGSPSFRSKLASFFSDSESFRAKRRLDIEDEYVSTPKRIKSDLEREMGYRYLQQLESDITKVRSKLHKSETETERDRKSANCTCAIMEKQFLAMAESAYRSVRRIDASPRGFEQFRRELVQTNEVMKDSLEVLKNIKSFCEHKS